MSVDSSSLIQNQNSVTVDLLYNLKNSAGTSRSYRASIPPNNFSSNIPPSSNLIFSIPCGRKNTYLDGQNSYLRLTLKNNDTTNALYLDNTGACLINMLSVYHSGNLIDQCPNYNLLFNYLMDFQSNFAAHIGGMSVYMGTSKTLSSYGNVVAAATGAQIGAAVKDTTIIGTLSGESFADTRAGASIPINGSITLCLPLLCSIFLNSDKMIPLGKLKGDLEFQILLETFVKSVVIAGTPTAWSILNAELVLQIIELSDTSQQIVDSMSPPDQPIYIHSNEWRYFSNTLASGTTGNFTSLISARYNSLKSLVCLPQKSSEITSQVSYSVSSRINPNIISYIWRVGGTMIPNKMVVLRNDATTAGFAEAYVEVLKSFHGLNNLLYSQLVGAAEYNIWDQAASSTLGIASPFTTNLSYDNAFCIAQELEVYTSRNDVILQGINTIGQNIFLDCNIDTTGPTSSYTLSFFANFDVILIIENGVMRVVM